MQGLERDEGRPEGHDEERAARDEREVPGLRNGAVSDPKVVALSSRQVALTIARTALDAKAEDLVILDLRRLSSSFDFFVLCSAASARRIQTVAEGVEERLTTDRIKLRHREGRPEGGWVLLDYGGVIGHIFSSEARSFYRLERLWADAPHVPIPRRSP